MPHNPEKIRLQELANKYLKGTLSPSEQLEFDEWFRNEDIGDIAVPENIAESEEEHRKLILTRIYNEIQGSENIKTRALWPRIAAIAASVLIFLSIGGYFIYHNHQIPQTAQNQPKDVSPGRYQATLTLANGKKIVLTKTLNGKLPQQGNTVIKVNNVTGLTYSDERKSQSARNEVQFNTLSTGTGEQTPYPLILADGSKVWLNAASSITYPVSFNGNERKVVITGEAYFEVVHNQAKPFRVTVNGQTVEDLGTRFNINSYPDDSLIRTSLLAGSISVAKGSHQMVLRPGQQSQVSIYSVHSGIRVIEPADIDETVAWKNNLFQFKDATVKQVMYSAARWYDLNVIYTGKVPQIKISGKISRDVNFSGLVEILKFGGVKFRIEGKNVYVLN